MSNNGAPKTDDKAGRARSASPERRSSTNKASSWISEEFETDRAGTVRGTAVNNLPGDVAPEHFRLYAACQKEWVEYDVYARVAIFLGFVCYIQSLAYYGLGHINIELKAFWVAFATSLTITVLQVLILRFDLVSGRQRKRERLPHCQWCGPLATLFASIGMALDFRVKFDTTVIAISWVFIIGAYILQFIYALRLLELVLPDNVIGQFKAQESIGDAWWPASWQNIPSTFAHVLYVVAPPTRLQPGQFDTVRETIYGSGPDPFDAAGEPIGAPGTQKVSPSQDVAAQTNYLDSVFEWALSEQVFENLSESSKKTVQDNFAAFSNAKRDANSSTGARVFQDCIMSMEAMIAFAGMNENEGAPGGYSSDSGGSAGSSDQEAEPDYTWDGRKVALKTEVTPANRKGMPPWRMVSAVQAVLCGCWVFMILAMVVDYFIGDQGLVTAPHWSKPPMSRASLPRHELGTPFGFPWYAGAKPFLPEQMAWHEEKRDPVASVIVGVSPPRRLSSETAVVDHGSNLLSAIHGIMNMIPSQPAMADGQALSVSWPGFFEPRLLACGPHGIAALTPRGVGALVTLTSEQQTAQSFRLSGLMHLPALLSASWQPSHHNYNDEFLVITHAGDLASCPRPAAGDVWACGAAPGGRLPLPEGTRLLAAAASWLSSSSGKPQLHVAFIDKAVPDLVALFTLAGSGETSFWLPMGEVQVPDSDKASLSFVGDGELLIATGAGAILRRRFQDGAVMASSTHPWGASQSSMQWHGACGLHHAPEGSLAHLRLHRAEGTQAWHPEIVASSLRNLASGLPLFQ